MEYNKGLYDAFKDVLENVQVAPLTVNGTGTTTTNVKSWTYADSNVPTTNTTKYVAVCGTLDGWYLPKIDNVKFYEKATVVFWKDHTKTVVVLQDGDTYDKEKSLALCFMKKATGNKGNFNNLFRKYGCDSND